MEVIERYRCELCKSTYSTRKECIECETSHASIDTLYVFAVENSRNDKHFPTTLFVNSLKNDKLVGYYQFYSSGTREAFNKKRGL
jgi:hypothetical protein